MTNTKIKLLGLGLITALLVVIFAAFLSFQDYQKQQGSVLLNHQAEGIGLLIKKDLSQQIKAVRHFKLYLANNNKISLKKFNNFSEKMMGEYSYINTIEWGVHVSREDRSQFESHLQSIYKKTITITEPSPDGRLQTAQVRDRYLAIKYVYPYFENRKAIGFDPSIGKGILNNLSQAVKSHKPSLSGPTRLAQDFQDPNAKDAIAVYIPVFSGQQDLIGFLTLTLDIERLVESILLDLKSDLQDSYEVRLLDKTYSIEHLLFETVSNGQWDKLPVSTTNISIANRIWKLELLNKSTPLSSTTSSSHNIILLIGILLIFSTLYLFFFLSRRLSITEDSLKNKELVLADSHASNSLLTVTFEAHQAIAITDSKGDILRVNKAFCEITGYSEPEVIGENPRILSSGRQSKEFYQRMWHQLTTVGKHSGEIWNRRKNGEVYPEMQTITAIKDSAGIVTHYVSLFTDITKQKQHVESEKNLVLYDPLTLLPNRRLFLDRLDKQLAEAIRYKALGAALVIDIDNFEHVNKKINYHNGDEILISLASRLQAALRDTDTVARLEGDEFAILIPVRPDMDDVISEQVLYVAEKLQQSLSAPFIIGSDIVSIQVSIGIALIHPKAQSGATIIRQATTAMFKAKTLGKNRIIFEPVTES